MNRRNQKLLMTGCWLGWIALCCLNLFRYDQVDADQTSRTVVLKSKAATTPHSTPSVTVQPTLGPVQRRSVRVTNQRIIWPLVLLEIPGLTQEQEIARNKVMESFIELVGGEDQDGNDPAYRERWLVFQSLANQQFRTLIGQEAFAACEMRMAQAVYSASAAGE